MLSVQIRDKFLVFWFHFVFPENVTWTWVWASVPVYLTSNNILVTLYWWCVYCHCTTRLRLSKHISRTSSAELIFLFDIHVMMLQNPEFQAASELSPRAALKHIIMKQIEQHRMTHSTTDTSGLSILNPYIFADIYFFSLMHHKWVLCFLTIRRQLKHRY